MQNLKNFFAGWLLAVALASAPAWAQGRAQFGAPAGVGQGSTFQPGAAAPAQPLTPAQPYGSGTLAPVPQGNGSMVPLSPGGASLGQPDFDPYNPNASSAPPSLLAPPAGEPYYGQPPGGYGAGGQVYDPGGAYPAPTYTPMQPGAVFPGGMPGASGWTTSDVLLNPAPGPYLRLFQDLRFRYTWLPRLSEDEYNAVMVNNFEVATTLNYPNFLWSQQPLQVSPGFVLNLWDGPKPPATADLPAESYDAYLNFGWQPQLTPQFGAILNTRLGIFTDFQTFNDDSFRILGQALLQLRLTPTIAIKGGVEYFDRLDLKLVPAGGILWTPNERTRFDIYFPRPKLAWRSFVMGNSTVWAYVGADIGGGSWTIERANGFTERVDMNDIRAFGGFEWMDHFGFSGFIEGGFVFERKLVYEFNTADNLDMPETIMIRAGVAR